MECNRQQYAIFSIYQTFNSLLDPEFQEKMRKRYLELRALYRSTGLEPKY